MNKSSSIGTCSSVIHGVFKMSNFKYDKDEVLEMAGVFLEEDKVK
jgi:hypothetical protein